MSPQKQYSEDESYWNNRAKKYGKESDGKPAICSYGMPEFYNYHIHRLQRKVLLGNIDIRPGMEVLDAGCGVGRWSLEIAEQGAKVTGIDISDHMVELASERAENAGLSNLANFQQCPLHLFFEDEKYDLIVCVTVLQHIGDQAMWEDSLKNFINATKTGGKIALLEVAPTNKSLVKIDSRKFFQPRSRDDYVDFMKKNGLKLINEIGMDFIPFKYNQLGKNTDQTLNRLYFQLGTYISEFGEYLLAPTDWGTERSWHRLMIFQK